MTKEEFQKRRKMINPDYIPSASGKDSYDPIEIQTNQNKEKRELLKRSYEELDEKVKKHSSEEIRIIDVLHNAPAILDDIEAIFEKRTSLLKSDWSLLMLATSLQLLRIYLLPKLMEKFEDKNRIEHDDEDMKDMMEEERKKFVDKHKKWESKGGTKYRSWQQILWEKVPYDATAGSPIHDVNMHGGQHRVKALGHDPVLGWIFGVCNIISDTITICPEYKTGEKEIRIPLVRTYSVQMKGNFKWKEQVPTFKIFSDTAESVKEDKHRLYAAIFAQGLHLTSDMYSKWGLPIPYLSLIDADIAYDIYKKGYDYLDFKYDIQIPLRAVKSAMGAILINKIIAGVHTFFYNPEKEPNQKLYSVRTRKIVLYSNMIATASDVIQTAIRTANGDDSAIKNMDFGGLLVTIYRLLKDVSFIQKIKEEFILNEWDKVFNGDSDLIDMDNYK